MDERRSDRADRLWREFRRTSDPKLREELVLTYAPLVKYVAGRLGSGLPAHVDEGDLVSYGLLGLIGAIERFDPARDVKFETYAMARIKGQIIDELRSIDWVPRSVRARSRHIERAIGELEARLGRAPTDEEIAKKLGISEEELEESLDEIARSSIAALDELWAVSNSAELLSDAIIWPSASPGEDETGRGFDVVDPSTTEEAVDIADERSSLRALIDELPERERLVISLYYFEDRTLKEIAVSLGTSESRVAQLHSKAVARLKAKLLAPVALAQLEEEAETQSLQEASAAEAPLLPTSTFRSEPAEDRDSELNLLLETLANGRSTRARDRQEVVNSRNALRRLHGAVQKILHE